MKGSIFRARAVRQTDGLQFAALCGGREEMVMVLIVVMMMVVMVMVIVEMMVTTVRVLVVAVDDPVRLLVDDVRRVGAVVNDGAADRRDGGRRSGEAAGVRSWLA